MQDTDPEDTYNNGWANRTTWLVNLHLTNDEHAYNATNKAVLSAYVEAFSDALTHGDDEHEDAAYDLIKAYHRSEDDEARKIIAHYRDWTPTRERYGIRWVVTAHEHARHAADKALKGWVDDILAEGLPNPHPSGIHDWPNQLTWDLVTMTLADVDWHELADSWIDDYIVKVIT